MKASIVSFVAGLVLCCLGFGSPASAATYNNYFTYSDSLGDSAFLDIQTSSPVTPFPTGVPVSKITGYGNFYPAFGYISPAFANSVISGPDPCCGADNILYSVAPYVDGSGIAFDVYPACETAGVHANVICGVDPPVVVSSTSGTLTAATPVPAAFPLFATGLGAMGLFGWRRKRKNAAALAAT